MTRHRWSHAIEALHVGADDAASSVRARVIRALTSLGVADMGIWWEPRATTNGPAPGAHGGTGCDIGKVVPTYADAEDGDLAPSPFLRRPDPAWFRRFTTGTELWGTRDRLHGSVAYEVVLRPLGFEDQLRLLIEDRGRFVTHLGLYRGPGEPAFTRREARALQPLVGPLRSALVTAAQMSDSRTPEEAGDVLLRPDGGVAAATTWGHAWLDDPEVRDGLLQLATLLDGSPAEHGTCVVGAATVNWTRLHGPTTRYLLRLTRRWYRLPPLTRLTPRQQEVAELFAQGMTADEVGARLGITTNAVKRHRAATYRALGLSHRGELAKLVMASAVQRSKRGS